MNVLILGANGQLARNTTRVFLRDTNASLTLYPVQIVNEAFERLLRSDVKYRFVIDMASLKST
jgi:dTDP-4-dehydrorhamnose reductase